MVSAIFGAQTPLQLLQRPRNDTVGWSKQNTRDGKFKSVVSLHAGGTTPAGDQWTENQMYAVVERTIDGNDHTFIEQFTPVDWGDDDDYCWFVDGGIGGADVNSYGRAEIPAVPGTYTAMVYISENASVWGVPVANRTILTLDNGGSARNVGGGIVGLPCAGHPFVSGDVLRFAGTTNYSATTYTLTAGTTAIELQFSGFYVAEIFDGSEVPQKVIGSLTTGGGHMVQDSAGNLYYAHINTGTVPNVYYVTKIETDGTLSPDYEWLNKAWPDISADCRGIAISGDDQYLYLWINVEGPTNYGYMFKFDLTTGDEVWEAAGISYPGYDISIDADGNAYAAQSTGEGDVAKFDSATGSSSHMTLMGEPKEAPINGGCAYVCLVDEDMGLVITAGNQYAVTFYGYDENDFYNLAVRTFDDSSGYQATVGPLVESGANTFTQTIGTGHVATKDGYIYVITATSAPSSTLYKYDTELNLIASAAGPAYGVGLYFDLWGNLVVVNQDFASGQDDVLWFYDTDLNYVSKIEGMYTLTLRPWDSPAGGAWQQGNAVRAGEIGSEVVFGVDVNHVDGIDHLAPDMEVCVYADGVSIGNYTLFADANGTNVIDLNDTYDVVIAGINYWSKLETLPLNAGPRLADKKLSAIRFDLDRAFYLEYAMGANSTPIVCDFNEVITSSIKYERVTFPFGSMQMPTVYIQTDKPVPLGIRAIIPEMTWYSP